MPKMINMGDIESRNTEWLWYPYIPYGKVTIIQGDPGEGKTTLVLQIAALLSRGKPLPGEEERKEPVSIIYQTAEDGLADTIKPKLEKADADCSKILVIDDSVRGLSFNDSRIEEALAETKARVIVFDPVQAYYGAKSDMYRANETRPMFKRLANIAETYNCAVILIGHMNKTNHTKAAYRGLGSIDSHAAARSVLLVARLKDEQNVRVIAQIKNSLAPEGKPFAFSLGENGMFEWLDELEIDTDELLKGAKVPTKLKGAENFIKNSLKDGIKPAQDILDEAKKLNICERTLNTAKKKLGVKSIRNAGKWFWMLETPETEVEQNILLTE